MCIAFWGTQEMRCDTGHFRPLRILVHCKYLSRWSCPPCACSHEPPPVWRQWSRSAGQSGCSRELCWAPYVHSHMFPNERVPATTEMRGKHSWYATSVKTPKWLYCNDWLRRGKPPPSRVVVNRKTPLPEDWCTPRPRNLCETCEKPSAWRHRLCRGVGHWQYRVVNTRIRSLRMKDHYEDRVSQFVKSRANGHIMSILYRFVHTEAFQNRFTWKKLRSFLHFKITPMLSVMTTSTTSWASCELDNKQTITNKYP